jgi:hypothetical protein
VDLCEAEKTRDLNKSQSGVMLHYNLGAIVAHPKILSTESKQLRNQEAIAILWQNHTLESGNL